MAEIGGPKHAKIMCNINKEDKITNIHYKSQNNLLIILKTSGWSYILIVNVLQQNIDLLYRISQITEPKPSLVYKMSVNIIMMLYHLSLDFAFSRWVISSLRWWDLFDLCCNWRRHPYLPEYCCMELHSLALRKVKSAHFATHFFNQIIKVHFRKIIGDLLIFLVHKLPGGL